MVTEYFYQCKRCNQKTKTQKQPRFCSRCMNNTFSQLPIVLHNCKFGSNKPITGHLRGIH